jgi:hypothetical protein
MCLGVGWGRFSWNKTATSAALTEHDERRRDDFLYLLCFRAGGGANRMNLPQPVGRPDQQPRRFASPARERAKGAASAHLKGPARAAWMHDQAVAAGRKGGHAKARVRRRLANETPGTDGGTCGPRRTLVDEAFGAALDGVVVNIGDDAWQIAVDSALLGRGRLRVQLTVRGPFVWLLTLSLPPSVDRLRLMAAVAMFLRQPEQKHRHVVSAVRAAVCSDIEAEPPRRGTGDSKGRRGRPPDDHRREPA